MQASQPSRTRLGLALRIRALNLLRGDAKTCIYAKRLDSVNQLSDELDTNVSKICFVGQIVLTTKARGY
jgi:hypothetical protein